MKKALNHLTIESLASYVLDLKHPGSQLNLDQQVERIGGWANFLLRIFSKEQRLLRVYLVTASLDPVDRNEQPFRQDIMGYFRKYKTDPPDNYYILKIQLDQHYQPLASKTFALPDTFRQQ